MSEAGGSDRASLWPFSAARRGRLRGLVILSFAVVVLVNGIVWVTVATFSDPLSPGLDPRPEIGRSAEFAVLATTLSVLIMRAILRKRVTVLWVIAALAMWMLMPGTLLLAWFGGRYWGFAGLVIVMAPVLLMAAALVLIARGFLARGTAALVLPLLLVVCVRLCQPEPPRAATWIFVPSGNAALALTAAAAATWQQRASGRH